MIEQYTTVILLKCAIDILLIHIGMSRVIEQYTTDILLKSAIDILLLHNSKSES